jgi:hypothetical protein
MGRWVKEQIGFLEGTMKEMMEEGGVAY